MAGGAWKVGLLVVVFIGLLFGGYAVLGRSMFKPEVDTYYAELPDAAGVTAGAKVLMSGVKIGQVASVDLVSPTTARLKLEITKGQKIPVGSEVLIPSSLIGFGDNPVTVVPGKGTGQLASGETMRGSKGSPLDSLMPEANKTFDELNKTLVATRQTLADAQGLLKDQRIIGGITKLMNTSERTVGQFGSLANRLDRLVVTNQSKLGGALDAATMAVKDVRESTQAIAKLIKDGKMTDQAMALLDTLNKTAAKADELVVSINGMVNDPNLRDPLNKSMKNVEAMTDSGVRISADAEKIAKNGVAISENTAELTKKANEIADEAKTITKQLQKILGNPGGGMKKINLQANLDLVRETNPNHYRMDLEGTVDFSGNPIHLGLFDAFESNRITLQAGSYFNGGKGEIRYGVYASKPGLGVEYEIARGLALRGDVYDINNPRFDLRARYELGSGFYGWIGANQIFKRNGFLVGVGFRK